MTARHGGSRSRIQLPRWVCLLDFLIGFHTEPYELFHELSVVKVCLGFMQASQCQAVFQRQMHIIRPAPQLTINVGETDRAMIVCLMHWLLMLDVTLLGEHCRELLGTVVAVLLAATTVASVP